MAGLTKIWMPIGKRVAVIGGTIHGCELAEFLIKRGRKVTIIHSGTEIGEGMTGEDQFQFMRWMRAKTPRLLPAHHQQDYRYRTGHHYRRKGTNYHSRYVAFALPPQSNTSLQKKLEGKLTEIYAIGDCNEPHLIADAIAGGSRIAHSI